ncbi:MAG: acetyl esterase/lipase/outer membrane protein assembly factor BamB [Verrucomicrobiales bacterium]|jgi:acetyl esterase/lipase/outer membrane protein assembly factor BamB
MQNHLGSFRIVFVSLYVSAVIVVADEWPHQRGPGLDGNVSADALVPESLPEDPRIVWKVPATDGYAAPIIANDRVIYGDFQKGKETFHALRLSDAEVLWEDVLDDPHKDGFGTGPRCAPVSDGTIVLLQSCKGELHCLEVETGKLLWRKNYQTDFDAPYFGEKGTAEGGSRHGYNASPCLDGDHVIALAGGPGAGVVCLDKKTGTVVWQSQDDQAAYSPPVVATLAGVEQVICFTVNGVMGLRRLDGALLWRVPMTTGFGRHIVAPVIHGDIVIVGSHEVGLVATRVLNHEGKITIEEAWKHGKEMGPNISTPVCIGGHLYMLVSKQVMCVEANTGKQTWVQDGNVHTADREAFAAFIGLGDKVMMLNAMGELILFKADPSNYQEINRTQVCGKNWCHPAYASGKLIVRDAKKLVCIELAKPAMVKVPLPEEKPLWPAEDALGNVIRYEGGEQSRALQASSTSPSGLNRVFSHVSKSTYAIHQPDKPNGVGLVICPGGGYRDVWLDREGHDLALWLAPFGVTSLVLKYRTNNTKYSDYVYGPAVTSDAWQAIRVLREQAESLGIDPNKIGISGFSAGGNLALQALFGESGQAETRPNFGGLFYPWFREVDYTRTIETGANIPPLFIMNAADDMVTPAHLCLDFYAKLLAAKVPKTELHIVNRGGHGFDLGDSSGASTAMWKESFVKWMADVGLSEQE